MSVHKIVLISMGDQVMRCDVQRGSESYAAHLHCYPKNYLDCSSYRNQGAVGDVAMVSVQCAVCTGMSV